MREGTRRDRALALIEELSSDGRRPLDPGDRLADVGFDSLAFAELAVALERETGVDLTPARIGHDDRVADVLRAVESSAPRRTPPALPRGIGRAQPFSKTVGGPVLRWWFRLRVVGAQRLPSTGPCVLAMNHESAMDIPIIVAACPRPITFMAKRELFRNPVVSATLLALGGFRVDRDRFDLPAVGSALAALSRGDVLGMYPEGTRSPGELRPFLHGAAWVALRTGAPLVPCSIAGTEHAGRASLPGRVRVRVEFHHPIAVEPVEDPLERRLRAEALTAELRTAVEKGYAVPR